VGDTLSPAAAQAQRRISNPAAAGTRIAVPAGTVFPRWYEGTPSRAAKMAVNGQRPAVPTFARP